MVFYGFTKTCAISVGRPHRSNHCAFGAKMLLRQLWSLRLLQQLHAFAVVMETQAFAVAACFCSSDGVLGFCSSCRLLHFMAVLLKQSFFYRGIIILFLNSSIAAKECHCNDGNNYKTLTEVTSPHTHTMSSSSEAACTVQYNQQYHTEIHIDFRL